jgi:hypothetical protein
MMYRQRRLGLFVLMAAVSLSLTSATAQLNPLVTRTPQSGPVPVECAQGVAPAPMPRVEVREIPLPPPIEPVELPAPPTGSLRSALEETQRALTRNDRPAFDASLASARALLQDYPAGAQRRSAEELVRIYEATARLWDAQYESPFFDEASAEYALVREYPGYEAAVRRSTLTRDGRRYFPAGESRDFLGRIAAERLRGIGIQAPAPRIARNEAPRASSSSSSSRPSVSRSTTRPRRTPAPATTSARATRPPRSSAPSRPRLTTEARTPAPATSTPGTPNPSASPTAVAAPEPAAPSAPPAAEDTPTTDVPVDAPVDAPVATSEPTATTATTATTASESAPAPAATEPSRSRSVVLPTILILIGLGVLILLFRASK